MALTGEPGGPCRVAPGDQAGLISAIGARISALSELGGGPPLDLDWPALLGERAALSGFRRGGRVSAGGGTRLVRAADGWIAVALVRDRDLDALPAWLGTSGGWDAVEAAVARLPAADAADRAQLLGIAAAVAPPEPLPAPSRGDDSAQRRAVASRTLDGALVVDLSSLWAGPLCTHLLALAGARVVKVESPSRPDGARRGPKAFFALLNAGKEAVSVDIAWPAFRDLLDAAEVIVDSNRPRVWDNAGIDRSVYRCWVAITGYGDDRAAFGDDAAAAAGICALVGEPDAPLFCADAYADPTAGLHAAVAAMEGGSGVIDVVMRDVVSSMLSGAERQPVPEPGAVTVARPRARTPSGRAPRHGEHTQSVFRSLGLPSPAA
jgi:hypothetical protein